MSLRSSYLLGVPVLSLFSLVAACGGGIESSKSEQGIEGSSSGSSGGAGGGVGGGGRKGGGGGNNCTAAPACDPGDKSVSGPSACLQDDARCYERELCGANIWCTGPGAQCAAYPSCKNGMVEVTSCTTKDCVSETLCGATIYCRLDATCDGYPSCDPGHTTVPSPAQCLQDDAVCYPRTLCGSTIWCTGAIPADGGALPPG